MPFDIDSRIVSTCFELGDWPLSRVLLKNNADYPWFILVPREENVQDIDQLSPSARHMLMDEISQLSSIVRLYFKPDKLNIGALGNMVPQLHVHVIARFKTDNLWPHGIWQAGQTTTPYTDSTLQSLLADLCGIIKDKVL
jgi:diadenosine tetraphosphate (Ap4A) HIT family hydrolase